ncbi:MAG TPA: class I SAM-dependent methyltransferase [Acidimicrobiales bacterium]|nr:class I SAM-dependent methyltransferase [Acidimicrobiales bacterium]
MPAAGRWSSLVRARLAETARLTAGPAPDTPRFWDERARAAGPVVGGPAGGDPLLARLRRAAGRRSTVLDVGSGPGRFTLALAPRVRRVVAVDVSAGMLAVLARRAKRAGLGNVDTVHGRWPAVDVEPADVSVCSYVLPLVADPEGFLRRLDQVTTRRAFLYLGAASIDLLVDPFWRHFHGTRRKPGPTYLDAVEVLADLGIRADVEVVEVRSRVRYRSLAAAVQAHREQLLLEDTAAVRAELRGLLRPWLVQEPDGLRPPLRSSPAAIVSWSPRPG